MAATKSNQLDNVTATSRYLETNDDKARCDERMQKLMKRKPAGKPRA